ncbi:MAG TPA: hypothetical protein VJX29_09805 [Candidatus Acidoferrales bacterium]|nr:hypothetical protein [Candidatus Acidoferrales bacterium]
MGQQIETRALVGARVHQGTAMLETDYVLFRASGAKEKAPRVKVLFRDIQSLKAGDGWLRIRHAGGMLDLELGPRAESWAEKIRSPKSRLQKLGVAGGARVSLTGAVDGEFRKELAAQACEIAEGTPARGAALIFFGAEARADLRRVKPLAGRLAPDGALWVIYPKGQKRITENDVRAAGRAAELKDVKVVGFSPTHTALKFVIPLASR